MKNSALLKVLLSILLAIIAGYFTEPTTQILGISLIKLYGIIGQLFLNALTLVMIPLVAASIITGTAKMGSDSSFGKLSIKTFGIYALTCLMAIMIGFIFTLIISPGDLSPYTLPVISEVTLEDHGDTFDKISQILFRIVPSNIFAAAAQGQILGVIVFSLLFGFFITKIEEKQGQLILSLWQAIFQIMMKITQLIMKALPIGVFGLIAKVIASTGIESITSVALFFVTVLIGLFSYAFIALPLLLFSLTKINPLAHYRAIAPALLTAFSTSSSAASLPITIECVEKKIGVSNRICSFIIPLGASLNPSGSALYQCSAVLFIAQSYGLDLSSANLFLIVLLSFLTSVGMGGIPSASLISIVLILNSIGVPAEKIGLIMAVERFLDMCRTAVNVLGNTCCAAIVASSEGERLLQNVPEKSGALET